MDDINNSPPIKPTKPIVDSSSKPIIDRSSKPIVDRSIKPILDSSIKPPVKPSKPIVDSDVSTKVETIAIEKSTSKDDNDNDNIRNEPYSTPYIASKTKSIHNTSTLRTPLSPLKYDDKVYMFCFIIRTKAAEEKKEVLTYLHSLYKSVLSLEDGSKLVFDKFLKGIQKLKFQDDKIQNDNNKNRISLDEFNNEDFREIFKNIDDCDQKSITIEHFSDFCLSPYSKADASYYRLKNLFLQNFIIGKGKHQLEQCELAFRDLANANGLQQLSDVFVDMGTLADYIEDNLDVYIHDDDVTLVFNTIDKDGDNKISFDDFVKFLETGNNWSKSCKSLRLINPYSIVDVQISTSPAQESSLSSQRYVKVNSSTGTSDENGTFGKGVSLWYLRCKDGTGNGRLKPVIDIQLSSVAASSSFILQQYVRLEQPVRGSYVWIKRDNNNDKDQDLIDICVTRGKSKSKTDLIWTPPGLYWERVDGNFTPEFFGGIDTFLWLRPQNEVNDRNVVTKVRFKLENLESQKLILQRNSALVETVREILRNYTPIEFVKDDLFTNDVYSYSSTKNETEIKKSFDHEALFYQFDPKHKRNLSEKRFMELLRKAGIWLDYNDMKRVFSYFHVNVKNKNKTTDFVLFDFIFAQRISLNEFTEMITLNDHGINKTLDTVKQYIFLSAEYNATLIDPEDYDSLLKSGSSLKQRKFLHLVFRRYDLDGDGYLTKGDIHRLIAEMNMYITDHESQVVFNSIDVTNDGMLDESDFVEFFLKPSNKVISKTEAIYNAAVDLREWLHLSVSNNKKAAEELWVYFKKRHETLHQDKFPDSLNVHDIMLIADNLGHRLTFSQSQALVTLIIPDKKGISAISANELNEFMNRSCRSFGNLIAIFEKELCKEAVSYYRKHVETILHDGVEHYELVDYFNKAIKDLVASIKSFSNGKAETLSSFSKVLSSSPAAVPSTPTNLNKNHYEECLVSLSTFKQGMECKMPSGYKGLTLEEYCLIGFLSNAVVWDDNGNIAVAIHRFIYGICAHSVELFDLENKPELQKIERQTERLQQLIRESAKVHDDRKIIGNNRTLDFSIAFSIFDEECHGYIPRTVFCSMVKRLRLISVDSFIPLIYDKIDIHSKGYINIDDIIRFVKGSTFDEVISHNAVFDDSDHEDAFVNNDDLEEDDDDDIGDSKQSRHSPPAELTRNKEFNWLVWFFWRQCQRACIEDPSSCVMGLKEKCHSYVPDYKVRKIHGGISLGSLWKILGFSEISLRGTLSKRQFDTCINYIVHDGKSNDDSPVDYEALCNYILRMGEANEQKEKENQELLNRKFKSLWTSLKKELEMIALDTTERLSTERKYRTPKFTKILQRFDTNNDGHVSIQQFRMALRKLNCKTKWNAVMVRKLFQSIDSTKPAELNIQTFTNLVVDEAKKKHDDTYDRVYEDERDPLFEEFVLKNAKKILFEFVPRPEVTNIDDSEIYQHSLTVTDHIRDYFRRYDREGKGLAPAERFMTFCRQSGLKTRMTSIELNTLLALIRVPTKEENKFVDYDKFCYILVKSDKVSIPHRKAEAVLQKLQDVAISSATKGRDFMSLASLVDPHLTGRITKQEFIQTVKIMGLVLTSAEVRSILELLPSNSDNNLKDNKVDYIEVNKLLKSFQPYEGPLPDPTTTTNYESSKKRVGALPSYATPGFATRIVMSNKTVSVNLNSTITPLGSSIVTPFDESSLKLGTTSHKFNDTFRSADELRSSKPSMSNTSAYDRIINSFISRLEKCIALKRVPDSSFSLLSRFHELDRGSTGFVSLVSFQRIIESLGVSVSSSDITAILSLYGRREDEKINYVAMCNAMRTAKLQNKSSVSYANERTISRWTELKMIGKRPLQEYAQYDYDGLGLISCLDFREVSKRLGILQSENQLFAAFNDFSSISDATMVAYKDFCDALDKLECKEKESALIYGKSSSNHWSFNTYNNFEDAMSKSKSDYSMHYDDNNELDPSLSITNVSQWLKHSNRNTHEFNQFQRSYESLAQFKLTQGRVIDSNDLVNFNETKSTYRRK